jgi:hypothetical protein
MRNGSIASIATLLSLVFMGCGSDSGDENTTDSSGGTSSASTSTTAPAAGGNGGSGTQAASTTTTAGGATAAQGTTTPDEPAVSTENCPDTATAPNQTIVGRYAGANITVADSTKSYHMATNWWHKFEDQTVALNGLSFTINNPSNVASSQSDGAPIGYPTIYIGSYAGSTTVGSNLPKQVSALTTVHTVFDTNATSLDTSNINAAYDVWFTAGATPLPEDQYDPGPGGAFLMVWLFDPADRQPRGTNEHPAHQVTGVDGTWDVWIHNTNPPCITYVRTEPLSSLAFDLNAFIKDSVTNSYGITDSMYLSVVFAGFEVWGGGDGLKLKQFCADVK